MPKNSSSAEWLTQLAAHDDTVLHYLKCYAKEYALDYIDYQTVAMSPAAMVGLVETLVEAKKRMSQQFLDYARRNFSPPIILVPDEGLEWCKLDAGQVVSYGEWPKTERAIIESGTVYFRDFLRSFWRRLRRHPKS